MSRADPLAPDAAAPGAPAPDAPVADAPAADAVAATPVVPDAPFPDAAAPLRDSPSGPGPSTGTCSGMIGTARAPSGTASAAAWPHGSNAVAARITRTSRARCHVPA